MTEKQTTAKTKEVNEKQASTTRAKTTNRTTKKQTPSVKTEKTVATRKPKTPVTAKKEVKAEVKEEIKTEIKKEVPVTQKEKQVENKTKEPVTNKTEEKLVGQKKIEQVKQDNKKEKQVKTKEVTSQKTEEKPVTEKKEENKPFVSLESLLVSQALQTEKEITEKQKSKEHQPKFHRSGFYLTLETPEGNIGLWSSWTESSFYLGYPLEWQVEDELIMKTLGVRESQAVYHEKYVGSNKPCEVTMRKWGRFYSDMQEAGGRVWVDKGAYDMNLHTFPLIQHKQLSELTYGHTKNNKISTYPFHQCNEREIEAPTTNRDSIQTYRDAFLSLALAIASEHGGVTNIHIKLDETVWTPEMLQNEGYTEITYLKGDFKNHKVLGDTVLYAKRGEEELVLQSGNSLVPWVNNRKFPVKESLTVENIHQLLTC